VQLTVLSEIIGRFRNLRRLYGHYNVKTKLDRLLAISAFFFLIITITALLQLGLRKTTLQTVLFEATKSTFATLTWLMFFLEAVTRPIPKPPAPPYYPPPYTPPPPPDYEGEHRKRVLKTLLAGGLVL
jgi:hypothetical protein